MEFQHSSEHLHADATSSDWSSWNHPRRDEDILKAQMPLPSAVGLLKRWSQEIRLSPKLSCSEKERAVPPMLAKKGFSHRSDNLSDFLIGETRSQSNDGLIAVDGTIP